MRIRLALFALALSTPLAFGQNPETRPGAAVVLRLVSLSDDGFARLTLNYPVFAVKGTPTKAPHFFSPNDLTKLVATLMGDRHATILQAPKVSLDDGTTGSVSVGQTARFTVDVETKVIAGKAVDVAVTEEKFLGFSATLTPAVSADRTRVTLRVDAKHTAVEPNVPLFPITRLVTPVFEGGSLGQPIPFTQFVQRPVFHDATTEATLALADGAGAALYVGKQPMETRSDFGPPVISKIPYLNRLFKNTGIATEPRHLILIATASVTEIPLADALVADYRKAIAEGRTDDARALAMKALALDPGCFAK
jgi:type II secretory pathway component GspD/PulD (secretin)